MLSSDYMKLNYIFLSFQGKIMTNKVSSNSLSSSEDDVTPMVAFLCGKPAMYLTSNGWEKDESSDCIKDPIKILDYCKQVRDFYLKCPPQPFLFQ